MTPGAIVFINPNSTASMTEGMLAVARAAVPGVAFEGWTSHEGPPAIEGEEDGRRAVPPLLRLVRGASDEGAGAVVIGCADDTGLAEARALAACPVIGIGQAAYHLAALLGGRFSVVTTLAVSVPVIEGNIRAMGFGGVLGRVRASGIPVLELERSPGLSLTRLTAEARAAVGEDGVGALVLGCAGMGRFAEPLRRAVALPVIDGVAAAARLATVLVATERGHQAAPPRPSGPTRGLPG